MARVTVEDCILKVPNRFELVLLSSQRARDLASGSEETVDRDNDKNPVVALREIAEGTIDIAELKDQVIFGLQKYVEADEPEDDSTAILAAAEKVWADVIDPAESNIGERAAADSAALQSDDNAEKLLGDEELLSKPDGDTEPEATPAEAENAD